MKKILLILATMVATMASCSKEQNVEKGNGTSALTVSISKDSKAVYPGADLLTKENAVSTMEVLVFSKASKVKEKQQTISGSLTGTINGLTVGTKRVVVVANPPAALKAQLTAITNYDDLNDPDKVTLELTSQTVEGTGLIGPDNFTMVGENDNVTLVAGASNSATVSVERVVAKIKVGTITIAPSTGYDASKLTLSKVYVQRVRSVSMLGKSNWLLANTTTPNFWLGGTTDNASVTTLAYPGRFSGNLANSGTTVTTNDNDFFYVMPNNVGENCTLLTIEGTYNGVKQFYVFRVNDVYDGSNEETGKYIRNNREYTLNITLKKIGDGSTDPDVPSDPATLDVSVSVKNWVIVPTQSVEW